MRPHEPEARAGWRAAVLACAVFATYANALGGPFIFDDTAAIVDNQTIRDLRSPNVLAAEREAPVAGRPVVNLSFAVNYALGGMSVRGYHATNIALHALCAIMVFALLKRILTRRGFGAFVSEHATDLAFASALVWAVHPLNSEVVDYTTQRTESMMALCYLATIYAAIRAVDDRHSVRWAAISVASCAVGMACKESMVTAPITVMIADGTLFFASFSNALKRRWRLYAALAGTWLVLAAVTWSGPRIHSAGFSTSVTPWTYLLNQPAMIVRYLRLAIWPRDLVIHYGEPVTATLTNALPAALVVVALLVVVGWAIARRPAYGFLGAWFFVTLAPTSSFVPIATEVGADRRMYLPLVSLVALLVLAIARVGRLVVTRSNGERADVRAEIPAGITSSAVVAFVVMGAAAFALASQTVARNRDYRSSLAMAGLVVDRWPTPVAHAMLGVELEVVGRHDEGVAELRQSAAGGYSRAHYHLGGALFNHGQRQESIRELLAFVEQSPMLAEAAKARMLLGRAYLDDHQWSSAATQLREVLVMQPSNVDALGLLADSVFQQQQFMEAVSLYRTFISRRPTDIGALINMGVSYAGLGRADDAKAAFQMALQVDPRDVRVHRNLAALALNMDDAEGGQRAARQAVAIDDRDAQAHDLLGRALAMQGRLGDARSEFERAIALDSTFEQARADLALVGR
jgi:tetratricopeptide (TPR) repeat protein